MARHAFPAKGIPTRCVMATGIARAPARAKATASARVTTATQGHNVMNANSATTCPTKTLTRCSVPSAIRRARIPVQKLELKVNHLLTSKKLIKK